MIRFSPLLWSSLRRKPRRLGVTVATVGVAFVLFGLLKGFTLGIGAVLEEIPASRMAVHPRTLSRVMQGLPIAYLDVLLGLEGVEAAAFVTGIPAYYREPIEPVAAWAVSDLSALETFRQPDWVAPKDAREAFAQLRTAGLVGRSLADAHGWKVGDRVPLMSPGVLADTQGSSTWEIEVVGVAEGRDEHAPTRMVVVHYDYVDQMRLTGRGTVGAYLVAARSDDVAGDVARDIDAAFLNSAVPTRTVTDREAMEAFVRQMGDVEFFVNAVVGSALFTMLFAVGGTVVQSNRERTAEIGVLKAMGFTNLQLIGLTVAEALIVTVGGATVGLTIAYLLSPRAFEFVDFPELMMPLSTAAFGIGVASALGLVCALLPAVRIARATKQ